MTRVLPDSLALFEASPNPYLVLDRQLNIVAANAAYLAATGRQLEDLVGRWAWDAFPTDPDTLKLSVESFERVFRTGQAETLPILRFDIPRPEGGHEKRYWSITHSPVFDEAGQVAFALQHPIDVTQLERLREMAGPQAPADLRPEHSGIFSRARTAQERYLTLQQEVERLRELFSQAPGFMAVLRGPEHRFELTNRAYDQLIGGRNVIGLPVRQALPEFEGQGEIERLDRVFATGEAFVGRGFNVLLQRTTGQPLERRVVDFVYQPIRAADGTVSGIFVSGSDVTEAAHGAAALGRSEQELQLIIQGAKDHAIMTTDLNGVITMWSEGAAAILGWTREEALGRSFSMIFTPEDRIAGIDRDELRIAAEKGIASDQRWHLTKSGDRVFMNGAVYPLDSNGKGPRGFLKIARDETHRRGVDEALRESESRFRRMADALPHVVWVADPSGRVEYANRQWNALTGRTSPQ